jgi:endoglucanase
VFSKVIIEGKSLIRLMPLLVLALLVTAGVIVYRFAEREISDRPRTYSRVYMETYPQAALESIWVSYQNKEIQSDGRTMDKSLNYLTTSEGQSYSLLRAVWMDDKEVFDRVLEWTKNNLQKREDDNLFAWKWGRIDHGVWGILEDLGGLNTATDADVDIALALILAHKRWNQEHYILEARRILNDIWEVEVLEINGRPYLLAGNWAKDDEIPTLNPSYFPFAAYPIFADVNPENDWMAVKETSYEVLERTTVLLPPDWVGIDRDSGELLSRVPEGKITDFSDEAFRTIWRVGLDWKWHQDPRAKAYLERLSFLRDEWLDRGLVYRGYTAQGEPLYEEESLATYGGILPYFVVVEPEIAKEVYFTKLVDAFDPDYMDFGDDVGYYSKNWAWFGMAFYEGKLINIYK